MKIKDLSKFISGVARSSAMVAWSFLLFALSPMPYVALCMSNQSFIPQPVSVALSAAWAVAAAVLSLVLLVCGLRRFTVIKSAEAKALRVSNNAALYFSQTLRRWHNGASFSYLFCAICLALCAFPLYGLFLAGGGTVRYAIAMIAEVIVLAAAGFCSVISRRGRYALLRTYTVEQDDSFEKEDVRAGRVYRVKAALKMLIYWVLTTAIYMCISVYLGSFSVVIIIWPVAALVFIVWMTVGFPFGRFSFITKKSPKMRAARTIVCLLTLGGFVWLMGRGSFFNLSAYSSFVEPVGTRNARIEYDSATGAYTVTPSGGSLKVLQLTDIHIGGTLVTSRYDLEALRTVYDLAAQTQPDLIIVTGDILYPMPYQTLSYNNEIPLIEFCRFMNKMNVPWAFTYGNHDTEVFATGSYEDINKTFSRFSYQSGGGCMLFADVTPDIFGRYNQYIRVNTSDGRLERLLFLLDSNAYREAASYGRYDNFHDDQIEWYKDTVESVSAAEGRTVKSMAFFHIPMTEYRTAYELYLAGSDEVSLLFGKNSEPGGAISCPDTDDEMFETMVGLGSTQAVFVGHDHLDYTGIKYKGIDLVYGKSIDYMVYPGIEKSTAQRGATLITLYGGDGYTVEQIDAKRG